MALLDKALPDNITIEQGTTFRRTWTWWEDVAETIPKDLTGYIARLQIRSSFAATTVLLSITSSSTAPASRLVLGALGGTVELVISDADTSLFNFKNAFYDCELLSPAGDVIRLVKGTVALDFEVTR